MSDNNKHNISLIGSEINEFYESYREEIIKSTNESKIESFKKKLEKIKDKDKIISRIKSINNANSNRMNDSDEEISYEKNTTEYFDTCIEVFRYIKIII